MWLCCSRRWIKRRRCRRRHARALRVSLRRGGDRFGVLQTGLQICGGGIHYAYPSSRHPTNDYQKINKCHIPILHQAHGWLQTGSNPHTQTHTHTHTHTHPHTPALAQHAQSCARGKGSGALLCRRKKVALAFFFRNLCRTDREGGWGVPATTAAMHQINAAALGIMISRHSVHQGLSLPSNWLTCGKMDSHECTGTVKLALNRSEPANFFREPLKIA